MSIQQEALTIVCDRCNRSFDTGRYTVPGARGEAERRGWHVAHLAGGMHSTKRSADPGRWDVCPDCRANRPANLLDSEARR